jgi:hypothetical protein
MSPSPATGAYPERPGRRFYHGGPDPTDPHDSQRLRRL